MRLLITGSNGFLGRNLVSHLELENDVEVDTFTRSDSIDSLKNKVQQADMVCHLAGINRSKDVAEFEEVNTGLTELICNFARRCRKKIPIIFSSSIQAAEDNIYGKSKRQAENALREYSNQTGANVYIFRLTNVMGKWCKPNYNSVVATFCHNISNGLPIDVHDPKKEISLVYIDDVIKKFIKIIKGKKVSNKNIYRVEPEYKITLGNLATAIQGFHVERESLQVGEVGEGLMRALYATYLSYHDVAHFSYRIQEHSDERGRFCEILKTPKSGQFSFFTAKPGVTRGRHYHHTKNEKFLVVQGEAEFNFRNLLNKTTYKISVTATEPTIVETIPGWVHDITNTGNDELIVFLWANEVFDKNNPDTFSTE